VLLRAQNNVVLIDSKARMKRRISNHLLSQGYMRLENEPPQTLARSTRFIVETDIAATVKIGRLRYCYASKTSMVLRF
jgi:hypothetical protein